MHIPCNLYRVKQQDYKYQPCLEKGQIIQDIDAYASQSHFLDHMLPVWNKLPNRGTFYGAPEAVAYGKTKGVHIKLAPEILRGESPIMVAAVGDVRYVGYFRRPILLFNHGVGFSFGEHPSYSGGKSWRCLVNVFFEPGVYPARRERAVYPNALVADLGCPKLDPLHLQKFTVNTDNPVICFSTHWNCRVCPETMWAFDHYKAVLPELAKRYRLIGHAHPRARKEVFPYYRSIGIEPVENFDDVVQQADLYLAEGSSTIYEFASTDKPVLVLNIPMFRRHVNHGLRFWEYIPGVQCDSPGHIFPKIQEALEDNDPWKRIRRESVNIAYTYHDGHCAERYVDLIQTWQKENGK